MDGYVSIKQSVLNYYLKQASIMRHQGTLVVGGVVQTYATADPDKLILVTNPTAFNGMTTSMSYDDL